MGLGRSRHGLTGLGFNLELFYCKLVVLSERVDAEMAAVRDEEDEEEMDVDVDAEAQQGNNTRPATARTSSFGGGADEPPPPHRERHLKGRTSRWVVGCGCLVRTCSRLLTRLTVRRYILCGSPPKIFAPGKVKNCSRFVISVIKFSFRYSCPPQSIVESVPLGTTALLQTKYL